MSEENLEQPSLSYVEKLRLPTVSIEQAKNNLKRYISYYLQAKDKDVKAKRIAHRLVGPSGVGKTEICYQIADELTAETGYKFEVIKIHTPVFCRDDFLVPFPSKERNTFEMLMSDFFPRDKDSYGIYVIDEFSRGDSQLQQLLWQIQNEHRLHLIDLPENWFVVCTDNPDDELYNMVESFDDAAGLRRVLHISVSVNVLDFLKFARDNGIHPYVIEFIQTYPADLYDVGSQKQGAVYANPASWHKFSDLLWSIQSVEGEEKILDNITDLEISGSGLLNYQTVQKFIDFLKDKRIVKPSDVINNYDAVRETLKELVKENNTPKLSAISESVALYLISSLPNLTKKVVNNLIEFLSTVPVDTAAILFHQFDAQRDNKCFAFLGSFHENAMKDDRYSTVWNSLEEALKRMKG
jgi:hypothetical protein